MLPGDIDIVIGGSTHNYTLNHFSDGRSERVDTTNTNLSTPSVFTVAKSTSGKGERAVDSYLMRLDQTVATNVDASSNVLATQTLSAYVVVKIPRGIPNGKTQAYNMVYALESFLLSTLSGSSVKVVSRILNGEF